MLGRNRRRDKFEPARGLRQKAHFPTVSVDEGKAANDNHAVAFPEQSCREMSASFWRAIPAELLERVTTPCMIYSAEQIRKNLAALRICDSPSQRRELRYAIKACPLGPVLREVSTAGWGADCQSRMEAGNSVDPGFRGAMLALSSPRLSRDDALWCITNVYPQDQCRFRQPIGDHQRSFA